MRIISLSRKSLPIMKHAYSVCCTFSLVCIFLLFSSIWTAAATANEVSAQHVLEQAPLEVHVTTLTLEENDRSAKRRAEEKRQLLQRLVRKKSCTDQNHPRARLLTALHGFSRYEERNKADLQRWKTNYGHVPKHQKKASCSWRAALTSADLFRSLKEPSTIQTSSPLLRS